MILVCDCCTREVDNQLEFIEVDEEGQIECEDCGDARMMEAYLEYKRDRPAYPRSLGEYFAMKACDTRDAT